MPPMIASAIGSPSEPARTTDSGVPPTAILGEDRARNTQESIAAVAAILRDHGMRSAVFVSDRTHMLRVLRMAKDVGVEAYGSPTASSPSDATLESRLEATVHELGALILYALSGTGSIDSMAIAGGAAGPTTADLTGPNAP